MAKDPQNLIFYIVRGIVALAGWGAAIYVLYRYDCFSSAKAMPIVLLVVASAAFSALMLLPRGKNTRIISIILTVIIVAAIALTPSALGGFGM